MILKMTEKAARGFKLDPKYQVTGERKVKDGVLVFYRQRKPTKRVGKILIKNGLIKKR
jgi:hypothetical protein